MDLARRLPLRRRTSRNAPARATGARQLTDPDWHFPYFDENMGRAVGEDYAAADVLLLGRVTYDSFAGAWPDRETAGGEDASYAAQLGDTPKIVVSRWPRSRLLPASAASSSPARSPWCSSCSRLD